MRDVVTYASVIHIEVVLFGGCIPLHEASGRRGTGRGMGIGTVYEYGYQYG